MRVTQILNEIADAAFPGKYNSDFAVQVTSPPGVKDGQQMAVNFANNNLNGHTRFLDGYISARTRVCVTVGMMTTGYDCEDLQNIVLLRPIFSPTDFIQIKGRGTRKYIGQATKMPVRLAVAAISDEKQVPNSGDPEFGKHWGHKMVERQEPDIAKICDYWTRSEKPKPDAGNGGEGKKE